MEMRMYATGTLIVDGIWQGDIPDDDGRPWSGSLQEAKRYLAEVRKCCVEAGSDDDDWSGWQWQIEIGIAPEDDEDRACIGITPIMSGSSLVEMVGGGE